MRARCERHGLALGPSGCLLCRREQATPAPDTQAAAGHLVGGGALAVAPPAPSDPVSAAAFAAAPTFAAAAPSAPTLASTVEAASPAPATVTDAPQSRRLSIQIPPAALLLPIAAAVLIVVLKLSLGSDLDEKPAGPVSAQAESAAAEPDPVHGERGSEAAAEDGAGGAETSAAPEVLTAELVRLREKAERAAARAQQLSDARSRVKVTLYYTERCTRCIEAQGYFLANGIHAQERDIDKDAKARARHRKLNPRGSLPTIEIEGQVLAGFDSERLERALDRAARARIRRGR